MILSPNICPPPNLHLILPRRTCPFPALQQLGLLQDFQTSSHLSSGSQEARETEEAEDVVKAVDNEAEVTHGRWHLHSIHRQDLDSRLH